ncbi:8625_t:CDS:2 [Entrophospora sp. SA101]|nr:14963_t:CDS:2 [Entrophospora sp. SA101]CAJ0927585.1 8625_t:CDS:2 [Entrophospora sp. SA101]
MSSSNKNSKKKTTSTFITKRESCLKKETKSKFFKQKTSQYKKLLVHDRIEAYETVQVLEKPVALVTIYDVICFTKKACNVNSNKNFWKHTGILLENLEFLNNVEEENHEIQDSLLAGEHLIMEDENIDLAKFFLQIP